jgi:Transposase DDE domain
VNTGTSRGLAVGARNPTLTDPARYPAWDLAVLYHERWEVETAYLELKSTILGGRVLHARTPGGIEQEIYALLVTYQALRTAIADAAATVPGTDPDRASFAIGLNAVRDQVILAAGVIAGTITNLAGRIGRTVLASLIPSRRLRVSPRVVKRTMSKHNAKGKVERATYKATIAITILANPLTPDDESLTNRPCR